MNRDQIIIDGYESGTPVADIASNAQCGAATVKRVAKRLGLQHPGRSGFNGIIGEKGSSLTMESKMRDATKEEQSRIERLLEKNGYRPQWGVAWPRLDDDGVKTTVMIKNPQEIQQEEEWREEFLKRVSQAAPRSRKKPVPTKNLAIFGNFDAHIGKHCEVMRTGHEYTPEKAISQLIAGQNALYEMTKLHNVTDIVFPMGNDIVHVDNNSHTSTSGTPQDAYGSVESMMYLAAELYIKTIEEWAKTHNVWLCHVNSNHDRVAGWAVSQMVSRYFEKHPRVHVSYKNTDQRHRKYFVFGRSLIMFHHGEGKEERLLGVIKAEATKAFWETDRIYVYQGHVHHRQTNKRGINTQQTEKDHSAVTVISAGHGIDNQMHVETLRSPSPPDEWHARSLYHNIPAVEVFLHNERHQFGRFTHEF